MDKIPYLLELHIPLCPPRLNSILRMNRFERNKLFKTYYFLIESMVKGRKPNHPLEKCKITIVRYHYRSLDYDNCVASFKPFIDALTGRHSGIIGDDDYKTTGPWDVDQVFSPKSEGPKTYIKIEGFQEARSWVGMKTKNKRLKEEDLGNY